MIRFDKVTKTFPNGKTVLKEISFTIDEGELVAIVGPSGAGKTTILRLILGELRPSAGDISVDSLKIKDLRPKELPKLRKAIGGVFQDFKLIEDRTVEENIGIVLEFMGETDQKILERVSEVLRLINLSDAGKLFPKQLSGGELQRIALARAIAHRPKILFADEPTGNLDVESAQKIARILKDINSAGTTVIVASHDENVLSLLNPRILKLAAGKLI